MFLCSNRAISDILWGYVTGEIGAINCMYITDYQIDFILRTVHFSLYFGRLQGVTEVDNPNPR